MGIEAPGDIDVEAIAWDCGASVRDRRLEDCEARIVGLGGRAIISVDDRIPPRRRRFSIAHELGHWRHHRDRCLICRADQIGDARQSAIDPERVADEYASDLLLPRFLLERQLRMAPKPTLRAMREIADAFDTSLTATLIKVVEIDRYPIIVVCNTSERRRWFRRSPCVPARWFPIDRLDGESCASALLAQGGAEERYRRRIGADAWFDERIGKDFEVLEQSFAAPNGEVITVLHLVDDEMLEE